MTTRANIAVRTSFLSSEFGESYARKMFGDDIVNALPKITRGANAGKPKGCMAWVKVESGGWVPTLGVEHRRGSVVAATLYLQDYNTGKKTPIITKELLHEQSQHRARYIERGAVDAKGWIVHVNGDENSCVSTDCFAYIEKLYPREF